MRFSARQAPTSAVNVSVAVSAGDTFVAGETLFTIETSIMRWYVTFAARVRIRFGLTTTPRPPRGERQSTHEVTDA